MPLKEKESDSKIKEQLSEILRKQEYSLNAVNNYGDSLLHITAANGCTDIIKKLLIEADDCKIDRKNKFGWTPLMLAARNNELETVRLLLEHGASVNQRTYLGISTLSLGAAISREMFQTLYEASPSTLTKASSDDITPLCVAAMKNDKKLFFDLVNRGLSVDDENEYAHLMMRRSTVAEIVALAKPHLSLEDYWSEPPDLLVQEASIANSSRHHYRDTDTSRGVSHVFRDSKQIGADGVNETSTTIVITEPEEQFDGEEGRSKFSKVDKMRLNGLDLLSVNRDGLQNSSSSSSSISPNLDYNIDAWFAASPNLIYSPNYVVSQLDEVPSSRENRRCDGFAENNRQNCSKVFTFDVAEQNPILERTHHRAREISYRCPARDDTNLSFTPEFSPSKSPCCPSDFEDDDLCGENTPTPPHCETPPRGTVLDARQTEIVAVLRHMDLSHLVTTFLIQEIDMELFVTLTDQDLIEIGVINEADRRTILQTIQNNPQNENMSYYQIL